MRFGYVSGMFWLRFSYVLATLWSCSVTVGCVSCVLAIRSVRFGYLRVGMFGYVLTSSWVFGMCNVVSFSLRSGYVRLHVGYLLNTHWLLFGFTGCVLGLCFDYILVHCVMAGCVVLCVVGGWVF